MCSGDEIVYSPGAGGFTNPSQSAISQWGWGFHTVRGGIDLEDHRCLPRFVGVVDTWKIADPGMGPYPARVALDAGSTNPRLGFPHRAGRYWPGGQPFRPQYVGAVDVRKDLPSEDCTLSSPGVAGPTNWSCLLYTSPSPRDGLLSRMPSSA